MRIFSTGFRSRAIAAITVLIVPFLAVAPARAGVFYPKTFELANGMQVVVIEDHRAPVVSQMIWFKVGAADEQIGTSGIAHFLEHLMFKGTDKLKADEFSDIIAKNGGQENAFTSRDYTGYFQNVARDKLDLVMGLFADQMQHLKLTEKDVTTERKVILEERNMRIDNNPRAKFNVEFEAAFYRASHYGIPIIGWRNEMEKLDLADAVAWHKKYYTPNNAILVIAGDTTVEEVKRLAEKHYGPIPRGPEIVRHWSKEPPHRADITVTYRDPEIKRPSVRFSYLAPAARDEAGKKYAMPLVVLEQILSGSRDSLLNKKLVIEDKIAVGAGAYYDATTYGPTEFGFYGTPAPGHTVEEVDKALRHSVQQILDKGVSAGDVKTAIRRLTAGMVLARDNLFTGPRVVGNVLTAGLPLDYLEQWPEHIAAVTPAEVNAAAAYVFKGQHAVTGYLLPQSKNAGSGKKAAASSKEVGQ